MTRRARAAAFIVAAGACALLAAMIANGYGRGASSQLGALRPVVVTASELRAGRRIRASDASRRLELRRVPERFAPPDAIAAPELAVGRSPAVSIPIGSYLVGSQLRAPRSEGRQREDPALGRGRAPVDISVAGAGALLAGRSEGRRVDAVITTEPGASGRGRTFVAARAVRLLALAEGGSGGLDDGEAPGPPGWTATLALTRREALRLIQAESYARAIRLLPGSAPR